MAMCEAGALYGETLSERHVQAIWYDGALRPSALMTVRGQTVKVLEPGEWNLEAGPDFLHAALEVDGVRRTGDVEVHMRPGDWRSHGHAQDPAYANVIAHVTWFDGEPPDGEDGLPEGCVSVCIGGCFGGEPGFAPAEIDLSAYPYARPPMTPRPCAARFAGDPDAALAVIREAGRCRIAIKAQRLAGRFAHMDRDQALYEEMFVALGYKHNAFPFRSIAQAMPWRDVPEGREAAQTCYDCVAGLKVTSETPWRLSNVRPANAPARRLAAAAALFSQGTALRERLMACNLAEKGGQREAVAILREGRLIGPGRAGAIMANAVVPFALATGTLQDVPEWIAPEDVSAPVRQTAHRMLGRDHNPALYSRNGLLVQGLLHIHHTCCMACHPACDGCPLRH